MVVPHHSDESPASSPVSPSSCDGSHISSSNSTGLIHGSSGRDGGGVTGGQSSSVRGSHNDRSNNNNNNSISTTAALQDFVRRRSTRHRIYMSRAQLHDAVELPDGYGK